MSRFSRTLVAWQRRAGRHDLPWQGTRDAYRIWLSEIMLQQTQVAAVIPYYERFVARYPDVHSLARATQHDVLRLWSGLGYYARARNLHRAARVVVREYGGRFPDTVDGLAALPGVGRSTAGAIAAFAFGRRAAILDGNVKRLLARCFGVDGYPGAPRVAAQLWSLAESLLPRRAIETYTQALMDLGATLCTRARPQCVRCPLKAQCVALREARVHRLPAPRPKKRLPLRRETWLVALHDGRVLLERRPAQGLWGGLWAFPRLDRRGSAADAVQRELGTAAAQIVRGAAFEHGFTHFRLRVQPLECTLAAPAPARRSPRWRWMPIARARRTAQPAPVARLLQALVSGRRAPPVRPAPRRGARGARRRRPSGARPA
ncbi:MAG TPA: A/G-specific adenine glycosylase [Burkholderiales bacterium]|nr:A/G-specific adenine glycosylase [Burkholderiales bacterium]